jgi:DDE_Tnp_1-associated
MDDTTRCSESQEEPVPPVSTMRSLYEVCQQVTDGRRAGGKRYDVAGVLVVLVLAKLAGMKSILGASDWIEDQAALLREGLHLSWKRMPCANPYSYVLARLDSQQVNAVLAAWFVRHDAQSRCGQEPSRLVEQASQRRVHLAIDGKALRGTGKQALGGEDPQKQVLQISEVQTGLVLQQCPIATKRNARQYAQAAVDRGIVQRTHSHRRRRPKLS